MSIRRLHVQALNIACTPHPDGVYLKLFKKIYSLKRAVRVHGPRHARFSGRLEHRPAEGLHREMLYGYIRTFTRIDANGAWFDEQEDRNIEEADREAIRSAIQLRQPDSRLFRFAFDIKIHRMFIESFNSEGSFSATLALRMMERFAQSDEIVSTFEHVHVSVVPDPTVLDQILASDRLRTLRVVMTAPNPDGNESLEDEVVARFEARQVRRHEQRLVAKEGSAIQLDEELRTEAKVAADNGFVEATLPGLSTPLSTRDVPLVVSDRFDTKTEQEVRVFERLVSAMSAKIRETLRRRRADRARNDPSRDP